MPKLKVMSGQAICAIMEAEGFVVTRQRGSHLSLEHKTDSGTIFVVVPNHKEVKLGTMVSIIRQSGLDRALFESS